MSAAKGKRVNQISRDLSKDNEDQRSRKDDDATDDKVRILQDNLVFVSALPPQASSKEILSSPFYFSRYGTITKLIINPAQTSKKGATSQAYVTYSDHLDAALAIVALDGYKLSGRALKVSYGTTKYCSHFLKGNDCPNPDCFYLHKLDKKKEVSNGDTRTIFKEQNQNALADVLEHLEEITRKAVNSSIEEVDDGFPSITEVLQYLVDNDEIRANELQNAFQSARVKKNANIDLGQLETRMQTLIDSRDRQRQKQPHKLTKSSSHSTMCTPTKTDDFIVLMNKKKDQRIDLKSQPRQKQPTSKELSNKQNAIGNRELKLEEKIEKLIIKQIWKKNSNDCKSRFVKGAIASREECIRLKGIVQKFLISRN